MARQGEEKGVLVIGGGLAGVSAAMELAKNGLLVNIVESRAEIGGVAGRLERTFPYPKCRIEVASQAAVGGDAGFEQDEASASSFSLAHPSMCLYCCTEPHLADCLGHPLIRVRTETRVTAVEGRAGDFKVSLTGPDGAQELEAGAIIVATGFSVFDPACGPLYEYGELKNVVTSLDFEVDSGLMSSGLGRALRPSDGREAESVAWIQCVGSRNVNACDNPYCSGVCCAYAIKESVTVKRRARAIDRDVDCAVFYMDIRTQQKGVERTYEHAVNEFGVRFIRSRPGEVHPAEGDRIKIIYTEDDGMVKEEVFDLCVLSVGLHPAEGSAELARTLGIELNQYGFMKASAGDGVSTDQPGVFVCGTSTGPMDIQDSVTTALAAAGRARLTLLGGDGARMEVQPKVHLPSPDEAPPRIAVFVEDGAGGLSADELATFAGGLPDVVWAGKTPVKSYQGELSELGRVVDQHGTNRVVWAGAPAKLILGYLGPKVEKAGVSAQMIETASIHEQATGPGGDGRSAAMDRAKDLIRMAVAKVSLVVPLDPPVIDVEPRTMVIGGGVAGMKAALNVAEAGFPVTIIEKSDRLGGVALRLNRTWRGQRAPELVADLADQVRASKMIDEYFNAQIQTVAGYAGRFATTVLVNGEPRVVHHGAVIIATGGSEVVPVEYLFGQDDRVMTGLDFDALVADEAKVKSLRQVVFIQCVGSREPERMYCSRLCCTHSVMSAIEVKEKNPQAAVAVLYRDMRTYGYMEELFQEARRVGVIFIRFDREAKPEVTLEGGHLLVEIMDKILGRTVRLHPDALVLASAVKANHVPEVILGYNVGLDRDGFFSEFHSKLAPVDLPTPGVFAAGLALYPKGIDESISQAAAAASRAVSFVSQRTMTVDGPIARVDPDRCAGCCTCVRACPFGIPYIGSGGRAVIDAVRCYGCGICASECPGKAIELVHYTDGQIEAQYTALLAALAEWS